MFCSKVFHNIRNGVAGALNVGGGKGYAVGICGEDTFGVHGIVAHEPCRFDVFEAGIPHALVNHGAYHFPMGDFFGAYVITGSLYPVVGHGKTLSEITAAGGKLCFGLQKKKDMVYLNKTKQIGYAFHM